MGSLWSQDVYAKAYQFAAMAHKGQLVPGTDLPYLMHVSLVAMEVISVLEQESGFNGDLAVQCALLHDTLEDTGTTYNQLADEFGSRVAEGVLALTKNPKIGARVHDKLESKTLRMADSLKRILKQPKEILLVKMADRITNLQPPPKHWTKEVAMENTKQNYTEPVAGTSMPVKSERQWAMACHLVGLCGLLIPNLIMGLIGTLVLWLIKREDGSFIDDQGKEALNFQISLMIYMFACLVLSVVVIGFFLLLPLGIFGFVCIIIAAVKSSEGTAFRYPACIRLIK